MAAPGTGIGQASGSATYAGGRQAAAAACADRGLVRGRTASGGWVNSDMGD